MIRQKSLAWTKKPSLVILAHVSKNNKNTNKKLKQTHHDSANLVRYIFKIREGSPKGTRKTTEERICERDEL